jgi:hypothetical protein
MRAHHNANAARHVGLGPQRFDRVARHLGIGSL